MFKRIFCLFLSLMLLSALLPVSALADETGDICTGHFIGIPPAVTKRIIDQKGPVQIDGPSLVEEVISSDACAASTSSSVKEKVKWIAEQCRASGATGEWEIALWLHDWLIYNANYDYSFTYYHPEGVLLHGKGVCQSYAEAYELLLDEFDIENKILRSSKMNHAWNLVKIDGQWCHVDCTWDDPGEGGWEYHHYFGMTDEMMAVDHQWSKSSYPACTSDANYYLIRTGAHVGKTREQMEILFAQLLSQKLEKFECHYIGTDPDYDIWNHFAEWLNMYDWKYGVVGGYYVHMQTTLYATLEYGEPWGKPDDFDEKHTHSFVTTLTEPTCVSQGYTTNICLTCGEAFQDNFVAATGLHTYTNAQDMDCNVCGHKRQFSTVESVPMHRMYDPNSSEHFYTGSQEEVNILVAAGWNYEGVGFNFPKAGSPVHRLYEPKTGEHLYTMSEAEKESLLAQGWNYEGVAFNSAGTDEIPQYRLHNPNATRGAYHFTGSTEERDQLISLGWEYQGIGWYSCLK